MKTRLCILCMLLVVPGASAQTVSYGLAPEWPGAAAKFGQVAAVAINSQGHVLVLHRGPQPIMEFDAGGKFLRSWGEGLFSDGRVVRVAPADRRPGGSGYTAADGPGGCRNCGAHSIRVDPRGNIWVADATGHVVYKVNGQGTVLMQLGERGAPGTDREHFNLPTDMAFGPNGEVYVSDGYANPRVVKFSRDGKYLLEWGTRGSGPGEFQLPHNLVADAQGRVYVTDRDNRRVQVFDGNGKFLKQWPTDTEVSSLFMTKDQRIWAGGVLRELDGKVVDRLPEAGGQGNTAAGIAIHGTAVSDSGDVYLALLTGSVQKFVKP